LAEAFGVPKRKHIFFPVKEAFKNADADVLQQLEDAIQNDAEILSVVNCTAGSEETDMFVGAVSLTSPAEHAILEPEEALPVAGEALPSLHSSSAAEDTVHVRSCSCECTALPVACAVVTLQRSPTFLLVACEDCYVSWRWSSRQACYSNMYSSSTLSLCQIVQMGSSGAHAPAHIEARQLSLLVHGLSRRLVKPGADAAAAQRVQQHMATWAKCHCLVDPGTRNRTSSRSCITSVSHALCEEMGYSSTDLLGRDFLALTGPGTKGKLIALLVRRRAARLPCCQCKRGCAAASPHQPLRAHVVPLTL
jgi:hypothetical protein